MLDCKAKRNASICMILQHVYEKKELPPNAYDPDMAEIVKECVDSGYIENIRIVTTLDGRVHFSATRPFVTKSGLDFLDEAEPGGQTDRIAEELKRMNDDMRQNHAEEKSEKEKDRRFQLFNTFVGALIGSIFTLLIEHWNEITALFSSFFQ